MLAATDRWHDRAGARWAWAFGAFAATFSSWLAALTWVGGPGAIRDYVNASLVGASGAVRYWSLPLPAFDWRHPATLAAGHRYAVVLFPATYVLCLLAGLARWSAARGIDRNGERPIDRDRERPTDGGCQRFMAATGAPSAPASYPKPSTAPTSRIFCRCCPRCCSQCRCWFDTRTTAARGPGTDTHA